MGEFQRAADDYQKSTELLIRKLPFQRLVREIAQDFKVCLVCHVYLGYVTDAFLFVIIDGSSFPVLCRHGSPGGC